MKFFNECDLSIISNFGSKTILAQNATLSVSRNINSTYSIGRQNSSQLSKTRDDESTLDFSYYIEGSDPIFKSASYIRTGIFLNSFPEINVPVTLKFAGISGSFYPTRYSFSVTPNSRIQANASFSSFSDISGSLSSKAASNNLMSGSGIAHAWNTKISGNITNTIYNTLEFDYSLNINWDPIYSIGQRRPRQVNLSAGQETFDFVVEDGDSNFDAVTLSTSKNSTVYIGDFSTQTIFSINTSGSDIDSSSLGLNVEDVVKNKLSLKRTF